jgi:hypothetical protein
MFCKIYNGPVWWRRKSRWEMGANVSKAVCDRSGTWTQPVWLKNCKSGIKRGSCRCCYVIPWSTHPPPPWHSFHGFLWELLGRVERPLGTCVPIPQTQPHHPEPLCPSGPCLWNEAANPSLSCITVLPLTSREECESCVRCDTKVSSHPAASALSPLKWGQHLCTVQQLPHSAQAKHAAYDPFMVWAWLFSSRDYFFPVMNIIQGHRETIKA